MTALDEQKVMEMVLLDRLRTDHLANLIRSPDGQFLIEPEAGTLRCLATSLALAADRMDDLTVQAQEQEADANV